MAAPSVRPRIGVLLNAHAKHVGRRVVDRIGGRLDPADFFLTHSLEEAQDAVKALLDGGYDAIWLGGGDGTITHAMNFMAKHRRRASFRRPLPPLGLLPLGTGNGLAYLVGSKDSDKELQLGLTREPQVGMELPLVDCDGWCTPFGSIGYDARVLNDYAELVKASGSRWSKSLAGYVVAVATRTVPYELGRKPPGYRVLAQGRASAIDLETREEVPLPADALLFEGSARAVLFGTSPYYGYGLKALPHARRRSDRFQVRISTAPVMHVLTHLPGVWSGKVRSPHFLDFLVEGVTVECDRPEPTQLAGEALGTRSEIKLCLSQERFPMITRS